MPDLLLEFFSEEIPARMQARAAEDLKKLITDRLVAAGLVYEGAKAFATPRRLALAVQGVPARAPDVREEKKGPRVGAPAGAIKGFLKAAGLASIDQAKVVNDKKGDFYVAVIEKPGRPALDVLAEIVPAVTASFPWPNAMRWGARSEKPGALAWVRPLHAIVATFGPETADPDIVPFAVDGIAAGDVTHGHRFLSPGPFQVRRLDDYMAKLEKAKVVLDPERRKAMILADAKNLAFAQGFELVEDAGLLAEVAGLVEWPVVLMGSFEEAFLAIPPEVIRTTIRANQKCFVLRDPKTGKLINKFILVANTEASDGGKAIVAGNERVIRARLSDAKFFYETDLKAKLEDRLPKIEQVIFHEELSTQADRIDRLEHLAAELVGYVVPDASEEERAKLVQKAKRAARLCEADLLTEVVGEFPELHGKMGKHYALAQGEDPSVAAACEEHYKPVGPNDWVPTDPISIAVALADKIDRLVKFWLIGQKPSGSGDPYALRRMALGVVRIILERGIRLPLMSVFIPSRLVLRDDTKHQQLDRLMERLLDEGYSRPSINRILHNLERRFFPDKLADDEIDVAITQLEDLLSFFADRLKVQLREQGARHDLVDAVFALEGQDDLLLIVRRVEALGNFLSTDDGKSLLFAYRRAANILREEEKKDGVGAFERLPDTALFESPFETHLWNTVQSTVSDARFHIEREDFESAMEALSTLRSAIDAFFAEVLVNAPVPEVRANRLCLLNQFRNTVRRIADFDRIEAK